MQKVNDLSIAEYNKDINLHIVPFNKVGEIVQKIAPFAKVAVLSFAKNTEQKLEFVKMLINASLRPIDIVLENDFNFSVDKLCHLFSLAEDVRCIIGIDNRLTDTIKYIASIKHVPCVLFCRNYNNGVFLKSLYVRNNNAIDKFIANSPFHLVLEEGVINYINVYSTVLNHCVFLLDYHFMNAVLDKRFNQNLYNRIKRIVIKCSNLLNENDALLLELSLELERICTEIDGYFYQSSPFISSFGENCLKSQENLVCYSQIALINYLRLLGEKAIDVPDYIDRARRTALIFNFKYLDVTNGLKEQLKSITNLTIDEKLKDEIKIMAKLFLKMLKVYLGAGGEIAQDTTERKLMVEFSGDTYLGKNLMTAVREFN